MEHNLYIFDEIRELSDPPIDSNVTTTFKAQKGSKDIVKIVNVTSVYRTPPPALAAPHVSWYSLKRVAKTDTEGKNCWIKSLFLFSLCTKSILVAS